MPEKIFDVLLSENVDDMMNVRCAFTENNINNPLSSAGNGLKTFEILKSHNANNQPVPKIILPRPNMPGMGGIEFPKKLWYGKGLKDVSGVICIASGEETAISYINMLSPAGSIFKLLSIKSYINIFATLNNHRMHCEYPSC